MSIEFCREGVIFIVLQMWMSCTVNYVLVNGFLTRNSFMYLMLACCDTLWDVLGRPPGFCPRVHSADSGHMPFICARMCLTLWASAPTSSRSYKSYRTINRTCLPDLHPFWNKDAIWRIWRNLQTDDISHNKSHAAGSTCLQADFCGIGKVWSSGTFRYVHLVALL